MAGSGLSEQLWHPATFLERGVAVPFTTPVLAGARARLAPRGVELVVPHPAGVRGVYIMAWSELTNFCAPTLHDILLSERIAALPVVSPREIRRVARAVMAEGAAGRSACGAATAADELDRRDILMSKFHLLQMLVQQGGLVVPASADLDRQAKAVIQALAVASNRPAALITNDIEAVAILYATVGLPGMAAARSVRLLGFIELLFGDLKKLSERAGGPAAIAISLVVSAAEVTMLLARRLLGQAQARAGNLAELLGAWAADAEAVSTELTRPEWLLDGWEQICLLWQVAPPDGWRAAVSEMALMVPVIPKEADNWTGIVLDESDRQRLRKLVHGYEDWRTGALVFELVARNEHIRALAA